MLSRTPGLFQSSLEKYTLSRDIPAIQVTTSINGCAQLGTLTHLPEGARLDLCGDGFNAQTIKVRSEGSFYFVFVADLEIPAANFASSA